jgi:FAD/FMN-containing dehydrogenase
MTQSTITGTRSPSPDGALPPQALDELRGAVRGGIVVPGEDGYDAARAVWNGMIDRRPAVIARCTGTADVAAAVRFARAHALPVAVRGGGHNAAGGAVCDGGVVIDLAPMNSVRVDSARSTVRVGGGARLGDIDHETQAFGLAVPVGVVSATGIGGLALHGGMGFLTRRFGLTSDNLLAADIVLADGRPLRVDEHHHSDLFWALRGGGGNFGIVTSFEFRAYPVGPEVWVAIVMYPLSVAADGLRFFRDFAASAPDELMSIALLWNSPEDESLPEHARNQPVLVMAACHSGPVEDGERMIQPLRDFGTPLLDLSGRFRYVDAQKLFDPDYPNGRRYYWKSLYLSELGDAAIAALVEHGSLRPSPISSLDVWFLGGALSRVPADATAFAERRAPYLLGIESNWDDSAADDVNLAWAREVFDDMQRFSPGGMYLNFPGFAEEGEPLIRASYGANFDRLQRVKTTYDPDNVFGTSLNIPPSAATAR